jgi:hypothetical protein
MECQCSKIPPNVRIIKIGGSEVGIIDLEKILRRVYLLKINDESVLREELFKRIKEKNYIPEDIKDQYAEAFFMEYLALMGSQKEENNVRGPKNQRGLKRFFGLLKVWGGKKRKE